MPGGWYMSTADILAAAPGLLLTWVGTEPRIVWTGTLPTEVVSAIKNDRAEVVEALYLRDERLARQAAQGGR